MKPVLTKSPRTLCIATVLAVLATAQSAVALGYSCTFDLSCVEDKSCQPSNLSVTIKVNDEDAVTLTTGGRSMDVQLFLDPSREARAYVSKMEFNTIQMMTVFADGTARFTQHTSVQDLQSLTHHGTCEVTP